MDGLLDNDIVATGVIRAICKTFHCDAGIVTRLTQAADIDGWDSLSHIVLLTTIEKDLGIRLNYADVDDADTVGELIDCVRHTIRSRQPG